MSCAGWSNIETTASVMTTHRLPFDQVKQGFEMMRDKQDGVIKPLITF